MPAGAQGWAVVAYLDARGDLAVDAEAHGRVLRDRQGACAVGMQIVRSGRHGDGPQASRWWREDVAADAMRWGVGSRGMGVGREGLADFTAWGVERSQGKRLVMVLMGHGIPPDAGVDAESGAHRILGSAQSGGMSAAELGQALRQGLAQAGRERIEVVVLEACFGASLEMLAELADCAEFVIAAPGEVPSPGVPWRELLAALNVNGQASSAEMAEALVMAAQGVAGGNARVPWSLSACDLSRIEDVEASLAAVSAAGLKDMNAAASAVHWARSQALRGEKLRQLCDAREFGRALRAYARGPELATAADRFAGALERLVVKRAAVAGEPDEAWGRRGGATIFLPPGLVGTVEGYARGSRLARSTGYGQFLEGYVEYCASLLPGLAGGRGRGEN